MHPDVLFGRLYYHLAHKYETKGDRGDPITVFQFKVGSDRHCIHFPYLAATLAQLLEERRQRRINWGFTAGALIVSIAALIISLTPKHEPMSSCPPPAVTAPATTATPRT